MLPVLHRLPQRKQMLLGPRTAQRLLHSLRFLLLDLHVAQRQQAIRIALAGQDGSITFWPLTPTRLLITSCNFTFIRSSAFCWCCTLAAALVRWSLRSRK